MSDFLYLDSPAFLTVTFLAKISLILFLSLSNGISSIHSQSLKKSDSFIHALYALTSNAHSVGSQITSLLCNFAVLHSIPILKSGRSHSIGAENSHFVEYPLPLTFTISPFTNSFVTVISFLVRVHVLSVQMIFTLPRVSTDERRRTSTFFFTNLFTPSHSEIVTTAGSHSGIAATARAIAVKKAD